MLTAITEQTRNSNKAARGLNSIFNNLAQVLDDSSSNGKKIAEIFDSLGVSMYDLNTGQLLSSYELLTNLSEKWDTLDTNTKNYIASTIAGTNQLNNFLALMNNFDHAIEATETALDSTGSAASENEKYMESLNAKTSMLKQTFQELSSSVVDSNLVGGILDLANAFLQLGNTPIGEFVIQVGLLTGLLWGGTGLINAMKIIPSFFSKASSVITGATGFSKLLSLSGPQILALTAGLTAVTTIGPKVIDFFKDWSGDAEYNREQINELNNEIDTYTEKLSLLKNIPQEERTLAQDNEIKNLEEQIKYLEEELLNRQQQSLEDWKSQSFVGEGWSIRPTGYLSESYFDEITKDFYATKEEALAVIEANEELQSSFYDNEALVVRNTVNTEEYLGQLIETLNEYNGQLKAGGELNEETSKDYENLVQNILKYFQELKDFSDEDLSSAGLLDLKQDMESVLDTVYVLTDGTKGLPSAARQSIIDFGNYMTSAFLEVDSNGQLTTETLENLISVFPELANQSNAAGISLIDANGNITQAGIAALSSSDDLYAFVQELINAEIAASNISMENTVDEFDRVTNAAIGAGTAMAHIFSMGSRAASAGTTVSEIAMLQQMLEALENARNSYKTYRKKNLGAGGGTRGGSVRSSSKKTIDIYEEQNKLFKEQNEIIEHNIFLREKQGASEQELIQLNKTYQKTLSNQANWYRKKGLPESSEYIRNLQEQWWGLQDSIDELEQQITNNQRESFDERLQESEDYINDRNELNDWGSDTEVDAWNRVVKWMDEWYSQGLIDYEYYLEQRENALKKYILAQKEAWEEEKKAELDSLEQQQNVYEILFSAVANKAQEEINALEQQKQLLEEQNDELNKQIEYEEALASLAEAKQKKILVYKDGRFQYVQDVDEVSSAQYNVERIEEERRLQERLDAIDEEIEYWQKYKEEWESVVSNYKEQQDLLLLEQQLGIKLEGENWQTRLDNLQSYVNKYNSIMNQIQKVESSLEQGYMPPDTESTTSGGTDWSQLWWDVENNETLTQEEKESLQNWIHNQKVQEMEGTGAVYNPSTGTWTGGNVSSSNSSSSTSSNDNNGAISLGGLTSSMMGSVSSTIDKIVSGKYALGTESAIGGLSLVGENGPELRILNSGDGILPSNVTKNLWGWSKLNPNDFVSGMKGTISITIDKFAPVLSNVTNGEEFANYLKNNFWRKVVQHVY